MLEHSGLCELQDDAVALGASRILMRSPPIRPYVEHLRGEAHVSNKPRPPNMTRPYIDTQHLLCCCSDRPGLAL
eukprot:4853985-Pyramimonas_sp.AAC.1